MNYAAKWLSWFKSRSRFVQISIIVGVSVILVVGFWLTMFNPDETQNAADLTSSGTWMVGVFFKLLIVLMLIFGAAIVMKRWMINAPGVKMHEMQVVETLGLTPKRALHIIRIGEATLLIGATDQQITLIKDMSLEFSESMEDFPEALKKAVSDANLGGLDD